MKRLIINGLCIIFPIIFLLGCFTIISSTPIGKNSAKTLSVDVTENNILSEFLSNYNDDIGEVKGKTYYVDAAANIGNDGLSKESALKTLDEVNALELKPGDAVLFKRNCVWNGALLINDSGTEDAPILYSSYGEGENLPCINGNGIATSAIYGYDISYVTIQNFEVTNKNTTSESPYLRGIFIVGSTTDIEGIRIRNCYVHDVESNVERPAEGHDDYGKEDEHWTGGIVVRAGVYGNTSHILNDVIVEKNLVVRCDLVGITVGGKSSKGPKCLNVKVLNNYVKESYGDGIIVFTCDGALIEGNVSDHNGACNLPSSWFAGIWIIWSDNCIIQYNEAFGQGISGDAQGFDVDGTCTNTLVQYNYSHDNYGGFLLLMDHDNGHVTVRYNISVNDGREFIRIGMHANSVRYINADIYNNTFYTSTHLDHLIAVATNAEVDRVYANVRNNIFFYNGGGSVDVFSTPGQSKKFNFENNCYYGVNESTMPLIEPGRIIANPMFRSVGTEENGMENVGAYMLLKDSPCLDSGMDIYNNGGIDYFGNKLKDRVNIGAYDGEAVKKAKTDNIALGQSPQMSTVEGLKMLNATKRALITNGDKEEKVSTKPTDDKNTEEWFEVDLGDTYDISRVVIYAGNENYLFPSDFTISVYDGEKWKKVVSKKNYKVKDSSVGQEFKFKTLQGSKLRIDVTKLKENEDGKYAVALAEIEIYQ